MKSESVIYAMCHIDLVRFMLCEETVIQRKSKCFVYSGSAFYYPKLIYRHSTEATGKKIKSNRNQIPADRLRN